MNQRVVVDSDDDEELSLENETTPEETGDAPEDLDAQSRRSLSPDELGPQRGTGSTGMPTYFASDAFANMCSCDRKITSRGPRSSSSEVALAPV